MRISASAFMRNVLLTATGGFISNFLTFWMIQRARAGVSRLCDEVRFALVKVP
jgi:hypothetical protein